MEMSYQIKSTPFMRRIISTSKKNGELQKLKDEYDRVRDFNDRTIEMKMRQVRLNRLFREIEEMKELAIAHTKRHRLMRLPNNRLINDIRSDSLTKAKELGKEYSRLNALMARDNNGVRHKQSLNPEIIWPAFLNENLQQEGERKERTYRRLSYGNEISRTNVEKLIQNPRKKSLKLELLSLSTIDVEKQNQLQQRLDYGNSKSSLNMAKPTKRYGNQHSESVSKLRRYASNNKSDPYVAFDRLVGRNQRTTRIGSKSNKQSIRTEVDPAKRARDNWQVVAKRLVEILQQAELLTYEPSNSAYKQSLSSDRLSNNNRLYLTESESQLSMDYGSRMMNRSSNLSNKTYRKYASYNNAYSNSIISNSNISNSNTSNNPINNNPVSNKSISNKTFSNKSISNKTFSNKSISNKSISNKTFSNVSNKASSNKSISNVSNKTIGNISDKTVSNMSEKTISNVSEKTIGNVSNKSISNKSISNKSISNKNISYRSNSNRTLSNASNKSVSNKSVSNKSVSNKSVGNKSVGNKSVNNKSISYRSIGDKSVGNNTNRNKNISNISNKSCLKNHKSNSYISDNNNKNISESNTSNTSNIRNMNITNINNNDISFEIIGNKTISYNLLNSKNIISDISNITNNNSSYKQYSNNTISNNNISDNTISDNTISGQIINNISNMSNNTDTNYSNSIRKSNSGLVVKDEPIETNITHITSTTTEDESQLDPNPQQVEQYVNMLTPIVKNVVQNDALQGGVHQLRSLFDKQEQSETSGSKPN